MLTLLGVAVVVVGFAVGFNPLLVVVAAALVTGLAAGMAPEEVLATFGKAFNENRFVSVAWLVLPAIGVLERAGLQERARSLISRIRIVTVGRLLVVYMLLRQVTAAVGLISIAGHAQTVKPLVAPMAEAAAELIPTVRSHDTRDPKNSSWPGLTRPPSARTSVRAGSALESSLNLRCFCESRGRADARPLGGRVEPGHDGL